MARGGSTQVLKELRLNAAYPKQTPLPRDHVVEEEAVKTRDPKSRSHCQTLYPRMPVVDQPRLLQEPHPQQLLSLCPQGGSAPGREPSLADHVVGL